MGVSSGIKDELDSDLEDSDYRGGAGGIIF